MNFKRVYDGERLVGHRCSSCASIVSHYFLEQHRCEQESLSLKRLRCWESVFPCGVQEGLCPCCNGARVRYSCTRGSTFQMMHIVSKNQGGSSASWNLVPGCGCNQQMTQQNLIDWMGTRGNKLSLMRSVFLHKYKSLVPPLHRSLVDRNQLIEWIERTYAPEKLKQYEEWLKLLDEDLIDIQH